MLRSAHLSRRAIPGGWAELAYTYLHLPMVAGIIVAAVGDELVLAHPFGHVTPDMVATDLGGPALFLAGHLLFKHAVFGDWSVSAPDGDRDPRHRCA